MAGLLHFEDFRAGQTFEFGTYNVTADEILEFAREFDPQPMHLSDEAARKTMMGGLVASGWHTCAIAMRLLVDGLFNRSASLGGVSVDDARWHRPVRPGDMLAMKVEVLETRASSKGGRGYVNFKCTLHRAGEPVLTFTTWPFFAARKAA
ncbi:MAG: MaoC family dehydratase [Alphaproteobacteria bacterium]